MALGWSESWELWLATSKGSALRAKGSSMSEARTLLEALPPDLRGEARGLFYEAAFAWTHGKLEVACERALVAVNERVQDMRYTSLCGLILALSDARPEEGATWLEAAVLGLGSLPIAERPRERTSLQRSLAMAYAGSGQHRRAVNILRLVPLADSEAAIAPHDLAVRARVLGGQHEFVEPAEASMSTASMAALRSSASEAVRTRHTEAARASDSRQAPPAPSREAALSRALVEAVKPVTAFLEPVRGGVRTWSGGREQRALLLILSIVAVYSGLALGLAMADDVLKHSKSGLFARTFGPQLALLLILWLPGALASGVLVVGEWLVAPARPRYTVRSLWLGPLLYALVILLCVLTWGAFHTSLGVDTATFRSHPLGVATSIMVDALLVMGVVGLWSGRLERFRRA